MFPICARLPLLLLHGRAGERDQCARQWVVNGICLSLPFHHGDVHFKQFLEPIFEQMYR